MTDDTDVEHRARHTAPAETIRVRQAEAAETDAGVDQFVVRMPITSTAEARDGQAFDRAKVEGFAEQIADGGMAAFIDHGRNVQTGHRYSALGKVGRLANPEIVTRDEATDLDADFRFPMPDAVSSDADTLREVLATIKSQAEAGIPLTSSIGWTEETGERDLPGDADLLEASIVGIPSDARTTTAQSAEPAAMARAVSAATSDFDPVAFLRALRQAEGVDTVQVPEYDDAEAQQGPWDGHDLDDFEAVTDDPTPQDPVVYNKFAHSETGFPPAEDAEFDSLNFPLVDVDGTLVREALEEAMDLIGAADLTDEEAEALQEVVVELAAEEFPDADLGAGGGENAHETDHMTDDSDESGEQPDGTNEDESDGIDAQEFRQSMLEMQEQQMQTLEAVADAVRQDDEDDQPDGDEDDEGDDEEDDEETDEENAADADASVDTKAADSDAETRTVMVDGEEKAVDEALADLRERATTAEPADPKTQDHVNADEADTADGDGGPDWRA